MRRRPCAVRIIGGTHLLADTILPYGKVVHDDLA
jgi:hypothetical protein